MSSLEEIRNIINISLEKKIENEIKKSIEPKIKELAKELVSDVFISLEYSNHFMHEKLKIDFSNNKRIEELEREVERLSIKLAQNGIN